MYLTRDGPADRDSGTDRGGMSVTVMRSPGSARYDSGIRTMIVARSLNRMTGESPPSEVISDIVHLPGRGGVVDIRVSLGWRVRIRSDVA